jgi:hypothetical protein
MKKILLTLITLAMAAHAQAMSDAEMKALLVGTWRSECAGVSESDSGGIELKADGTDSDGEKWDIQDGMYMEIPGAGERTYYYKILLLTKTEFLIQGVTPHGKGYFFYYRKPEDVPDSIWWSKPEGVPDPN